MPACACAVAWKNANYFERNGASRAKSNNRNAKVTVLQWLLTVHYIVRYRYGRALRGETKGKNRFVAAKLLGVKVCPSSESFYKIIVVFCAIYSV